MTIIHGIILFVAGALTLMGICWGVLRWERERKREYDERQTLERGNAYRISFWIGICYYLVVITLGAMDGTAEDLHFLVMLGVLIQVLTFHFCCLLTHAELPLSKNAGFTIAADFLLGAWNLLNVFRGGLSLGMKVSELGSSGWVELLCGLGFIILGLLQAVQLYRNREE